MPYGVKQSETPPRHRSSRNALAVSYTHLHECVEFFALKILKLGATPVMGKELDTFVKGAFSLDYSNLTRYLEPYTK